MNRRLAALSLSIASLAAAVAVSHSCANTTTPPGGGPKDTLPPVLLEIVPAQRTTGFPRTGGTLTLTYDEYTVIKTATDIFLSPPVKKKPQTKIKGKSIIISFQDTLAENTTYTLDFGQAIADNNEGNPAPRFVYTFSTGSEIDSMYITGSILDCSTLQPEKRLFVGAYRNMNDSACFLAPPDAATFADEWGFFTLRNIKPVEYRIVAFTDADNDFIYNPDGDKVAFLDSVITPSQVVNDSIFELKPFDIKDTLKCRAREPMYRMLLFSSLQSVQYLQNAGRLSDRMGYLKFSSTNVDIRRMKFYSIDSSDVIVQYNPARDSLNFWIKSKYGVGDSLLLELNYMKTDSTGILAPADTMLSMGLPIDSVIVAKNEKMMKDTVFAFKMSASPEMVEQEGIRLESEMPVIAMTLDSIGFTETNPKNQTSDAKIVFTRDTADLRRFIIYPETPFRKGYTYELTIPQGTFTDLYGKPNKAETAKITLPQSDELSTITLFLSGVESRYIVELTDDRQSNSFRKYYVDRDSALVFPYLKAGKYSIRFTQDLNSNGIFDMGNLLERRQPERVLLFEARPGLNVFNIPERSEIEQDIDVKGMFK